MKTYLTWAFCLLIFSGKATEKLTYNNQATKEFAQIAALEVYLENHPNATAEEALAAVPTENLDLSAPMATMPERDRLTPLVSPFWWGCCLGPIGLGFVYLYTENDHPAVRKAAVGCIISVVLLGGGLLWDPFNSNLL